MAGLRSHYKPEELEGKTGIIVANMEPAKLRGEVSQGMLLAAEGGGVVSVLVAAAAAPGASVHGCTRGAPAVNTAAFAQVALATCLDKDGAAAAGVTTPSGAAPLKVAEALVRLDRPVPDGSKIK